MSHLLATYVLTLALTAAPPGDGGAPEQAAPPAAPSPPAPPSPWVIASLQSIASRWSASLYGFVELDAIGDSTQSFNEVAGNGAIARPETLAGQYGRLTFGVRNSRLGFKLATPPWGSLRASAVLEMDFLGNQPPGISEAALFTNPTFRIRHFAFKLESPWLEVVIGQTWQLFGWQPYFHPCTVQLQGIPGEVYGRAPQLRLSRRFKSAPVDVEVAIAASRPPQRDSFVPDGQAGVRLLVNRWKGLRTAGSTGTAVDPLSVGVSGVVRQLALPEFTAAPKSRVTTRGWGVSVDALVPIIPATTDARANALTLTAGFVRGEGIADLYTGLTGGVAIPALPNPGGISPAPTYAPNLDSGLVGFDSTGAPTPIAWTTFVVGLQYHLPPSGRIWVAANFSRSSSDNAKGFGPPNKVFTRSLYADFNAFVDLTPALRLGAEYAWFNQTYADGQTPQHHRVQLSAFYLF